jgi:hypothetical protein
MELNGVDEEAILEYELKYCGNVLLNEICSEMIYENLHLVVRSLTDGYLQSR